MAGAMFSLGVHKTGGKAFSTDSSSFGGMSSQKPHTRHCFGCRFLQDAYSKAQLLTPTPRDLFYNIGRKREQMVPIDSHSIRWDQENQERRMGNERYNDLQTEPYSQTRLE